MNLLVILIDNFLCSIYIMRIILYVFHDVFVYYAFIAAFFK